MQLCCIFEQIADIIPSRVIAPSTSVHILMVDRSNAGKTPSIESVIPKSSVGTGRIMIHLM